MSLFEEYLNRGQWLTEDERFALYKYLLRTRLQQYKEDADLLLANRSLVSFFANGEICYLRNSNSIEYMVRKQGEVDWNEKVRVIKISRLPVLAKRKLSQFFAQAELDTLRNFPIQGQIPVEDRGLALNVYPYYTLNYYSDGKGKVKGLLERLISKNDPLLKRLLTS